MIFCCFSVLVVAIAASTTIPVISRSEEKVITNLALRTQEIRTSSVQNLIERLLDQVGEDQLAALYFINRPSIMKSNITYNAFNHPDILETFPDVFDFLLALCLKNTEGCIMSWDLVAENHSFIQAGVEILSGVADYYESGPYSEDPSQLGFNGYYIFDYNQEININKSDPKELYYSQPSDPSDIPSLYESDKGLNYSYWNDMYLYIQSPPAPNLPLIDRCVPMYRNGVFKGALIFSIEVSVLNRLLSDACVDSDRAVLFNHNLEIIATSTNATIFDPNNDYQHLKINESDQDWIRKVSVYIADGEHSGWIKIEGQSWFIQHSTFTNLNLEWTIVQVSKRTDFLGKADSDLRNTIILAVTIVIVVGIASLLVGIIITRPLFSLDRELKKVSKLQLEQVDLKPSKFLEVKQIHRSFNSMHAALSSFKRYVPESVIMNILSSQTEAVIGLKEAVATVVFIDIVNFTTMSEEMDANDLANLSAEFNEAMSEIIVRYGGVIDKYIGDCIMAIFNVPETLEDHPIKACKALLECRDLLGVLNQRWHRKYGRELNFRAGVNSGSVLVGNMGSVYRLNYTVIGDNVNIAARLEGVNKYFGTTVMMSEKVKNSLPNQILTRRLGTVRVSGKNIATNVYELVADLLNPATDLDNDLYASSIDLVHRYEVALEHYENARFTDADESIKLYLEKRDSDLAAKRLLTRIQEGMNIDPYLWSPIENLMK